MIVLLLDRMESFSTGGLSRMASRRVIYVGGIEDLERISQSERARMLHGSTYVFGPTCDLTEESALAWVDLRLAFRRAHLTARQRFVCARCIKLISHADIAREAGIDASTVAGHAVAGFRRLDALPRDALGCWTCIVEDCGGFSALPDYIRELM
jgi:DNA-binding CsgD family transcriptional regulator